MREPTAEQWAKVNRDVKEMSAIRTEFSRSHKFVGHPIRDAKVQLEGEGFECFVQRKSLPTYSESNDSFRFEEKSLVYCWRPQKGESREVCEVMWAVFEVKWNDAEHSNLESESGVESIIEEERYFCKPMKESIRPGSGGARELISSGSQQQ
jgi:hypothetical protein